MPYDSDHPNEATIHTVSQREGFLLPGHDDQPAREPAHEKRRGSPRPPAFQKRGLPPALAQPPNGRTYLSATDPEIARRTWQAPMDEMARSKTGPTLIRHSRAMQDKAFDLIRQLPILE